MFSTRLLPANKFPAHYSSGTIKRSGAPTYFKTQLDQFVDTTTFATTGAREFIVGLEKCKSDLSYDEKHDLFREADENGGGFIDREEFVKLMTKYSE